MALIECPECKKEISNLASRCPHCGYPIVRKSPRIDIEKKLDLIRKEASATEDIFHQNPLISKIDTNPIKIYYNYIGCMLCMVFGLYLLFFTSVHILLKLLILFGGVAGFFENKSLHKKVKQREEIRRKLDGIS